jgi:hypothetical protein
MECIQEKKSRPCRFSSDAHVTVIRSVCKKLISFVSKVIVKVIYCRKYWYSIIAEAETLRKWL